MADQAWTLLAVILGGVLTTGGTLLVEQMKTERTQRHAAKEKLRENLHVLLDDIKNLGHSQRLLLDALVNSLEQGELSSASTEK